MGLQMYPWTLLSFIAVAACVIQGSVSNDCKDNIDHCNVYASGSCDGKYKPWAMKNCRLTCNLCNEDPNEEQAECKDFYTNCAKYEKKHELCDKDYSSFNGNMYAEVNCRKYCGLCDPSKKYTGKKSNKKSCLSDRTNTVYEHHMKWDAGCMTCNCDDGDQECVDIPCLPPSSNRCEPVPPTDPNQCCVEWTCPNDS